MPSDDTKELRWDLDTQQLFKTLDIINSFPLGAAVFLSLEYVESDDGPLLAIYATNRDYVFVSNIPLINEAPFDPGHPFFVKPQIFSQLVKLYPEFYFYFDSKGNLRYKNPYVDYVVRTISPVPSDLPNPEISGFELKPLPVPRPTLLSAKKMVDHAVRVLDNKVLWTGNRLSGYFLLYSFDFQFPGEAGASIQFRKFDLTLISALSVFGDLRYAITHDRFFVFAGRSVVSFNYLPGRVDSKPVIRKEKVGSVKFDLAHLNKVLSFVKLEPTLSTLSFSKSSSRPGIFARIDGASLFYVGEGEIPSYGFSLSIEELRRVISVFPEGVQIVDTNIYGDGAEFVIPSGEVTHIFRLGGIDTSKVSSKSPEVIDRLKATRPAAQ